MSWNHVEQNWPVERHKLKMEWDKLTDDDIEVINTRRDKLEELLMKYYDYNEQKAAFEVENWLRQF
jgi:uncharacterized protein YjbJ (UPF0337 family)